MEQIYYTQCPIGYGLGASNGFQVKRITPGYSLSGDFRHLGLRAFPAGGRTLAPPSLRYRRVDDTAEVALLTPRAHEYETERGPWGRPGGLFAHGLILGDEDLHALETWPAGLLGSDFWRRSDPEPSRGRLPDPIELRTALPPEFGSAISLSAGLAPDLIARLLTSLLAVVREGRSLFLIDEPDRLAPRVAFLTFLFPPPIRDELTFSTYHDRPEELPGYRIHGTTPACRPNRGLLLNHGIVADLIAGTVDPRVEPRAWALAMAGWVTYGEAAPWDDFARRMTTAAGTRGFAPLDDDWLDRLVAFGRAIPNDARSVRWAEEAELSGWSASTNLAGEWASARGPDWWLSAEVSEGGGHALAVLAALPDIWRVGTAEAWGRAVARWFGPASPGVREAAAVAFAKSARDNATRYAFVRSLKASLADDTWPGIRRRLDSAFAAEPRMVALWSVPGAVAAAVAGQPEALAALCRRFDRLGEPLATFLEAARLEVEDRPDRVVRLGESLADVFDRPEPFRWALRQGDRATDWLSRNLRRRLALPDEREVWRSMIETTPAALRPALASSLLIVADDPGLPDEAFVWAVEEALLPIPEADRPHDAGWPGRYLDRSSSDLALIGRLFLKATRLPMLRGWLEAARARGDLGPEHLTRLGHLRALALALDSRDPAPLGSIDLGRIPGRDRGPLLARLLRRDAIASVDSGETLDHAGRGWPDSLRSGSADLPEIARAVAESDLLASVQDHAESWFGRVVQIVQHLLPTAADGEIFDPGGLVARVVACRNQAGPPTRATWNLRNHLINNAAGWKALAEDVRLNLIGQEPGASTTVVDEWNHHISTVSVGRFWEVVLNACDGRRLASVVASRAADLETLGPIPWWDHRRHDGSFNDLRDAFARLVPFGPLNVAPFVEDEKNFLMLCRWIGSDEQAPSLDRAGALKVNLEPEPDRLSPAGRDRWNCLERLTRDVFRRGLDDQARSHNVKNWCVTVHKSTDRLPLDRIAIDDRYRLVAWLIYRLEDRTSIRLDSGSSFNPIFDDLWFARVAQWLVHCGVDDLARIAEWPRELAGLADVSPTLVKERASMVRDLRHAMGIEIGERRGRVSAKIPGDLDSSRGS